MADSTISALPRALSGNTAFIVPIASLSASSTQGLSIQSLLMTKIVGRDVTAVSVNNSAATTSIYSVTIPGAVMGTSGVVRTRILGEYWHSSGATATLALRIGLSTTTLWADNSPAIAVSASSRPVWMEFDVVNVGATNSQVLGGRINLGVAGTANAGVGDFGFTGGNQDTLVRGTGAIDSTSAATLEVFVMHSVASTLVTFRKWYGYSELI